MQGQLRTSDPYLASRLGQINKAGDERALFLDKFAGEVLTAFQQRNLMMGKHRVQTLQGGRSYKFPLVGTNSAHYHTAGEELVGQKIAHAERLVTIDSQLVSDVFTDNLDELMNHYEVRSIYTTECANALANVADRNILRVAAKAASIVDEASATAAGLTMVEGEPYTDAIPLGKTSDADVTGLDIYGAVLAAAEARETVDIYEPAYVVLPPIMYYKLLKAESVNELIWINVDVKGAGAISEGKVPVLAGMPVYCSNHVPTTNQSTALASNDPIPPVGVGNTLYQGDYSKVRGLILSQDAVCTVKVKDLSIESEYLIERQGTLIVAKYAMGHNILRPCLAQSLVLGTTSASPSRSIRSTK